MRILLLSRWLPYPPDNGSKIRVFNVLKELARQHEISLISFTSGTDRFDEQSLRALRQHCVRVRVVPFRPYRPTSTRALLGLLSPQPRSLVDSDSAEMRRAIAEEIGRHGCDLVVASQLGMVPYAIGIPGVPAVLEEVELSLMRGALQAPVAPAARARHLLTWLKLTAYLRRVLPRFAACTVVSEQERANLRLVAPGYSSVRLIPNAVDLSTYAGDFEPPTPNTLLFSGALTYHANYDAVNYLLSDVFPSIAAAVPGVELRITGDNTGVDLDALPRLPGVSYTGYLPDVRPAVAGSWASLVPLRVGGGTRLKILEAMALGTPVVSTAKGAEGLDARDGEHLLIADSPADFASRAVDLLRSPRLRGQLAAGGRRLVAERYDWAVVGRDLRDLIDQVATPRAA